MSTQLKGSLAHWCNLRADRGQLAALVLGAMTNGGVRDGLAGIRFVQRPVTAFQETVHICIIRSCNGYQFYGCALGLASALDCRFPNITPPTNTSLKTELGQPPRFLRIISHGRL